MILYDMTVYDMYMIHYDTIYIYDKHIQTNIYKLYTNIYKIYTKDYKASSSGGFERLIGSNGFREVHLEQPLGHLAHTSQSRMQRRCGPSGGGSNLRDLQNSSEFYLR